MSEDETRELPSQPSAKADEPFAPPEGGWKRVVGR
jgi:hypothetical protein